MPGIRWSPERRAFLRERIPGYKRAQEEKRVAEYKKKIIKEYFDAYPQPDEKQVEKETKRLSNWYNSHTGDRGYSKKTRKIKKIARAQFKSIIKEGPARKKRQALQLTQAYSELYWNQKLREPIMSEWNSIKNNPGSGSFIKFMNQRVKEFYNAEPQSVKDEVIHYQASMREEQAKAGAEDQEEPSYLLPGEEELPEDERKRFTKARKTQSAIDRIAIAMTELAAQIEEESGLVAHILLAGPEPARQGRIVTFEFTAGRSLQNLPFPLAYKEYKDNVDKPWEEFVKSCFTKEGRQKYQGIPFPDREDDGSSYVSRPATSTTIDQSQSEGSSEIVRPSVNRTHTTLRRYHEESSDEEALDDNSDGEQEQHVDEENVDEEDFDDLFSPNLPPERRVVKEKVSESGLTLYKTMAGEWVSILQLRRLANIARNKQMMAKIGIPESLEALGIRAPTDHGNSHEPSSEDGLFRIGNIRPSLPRRVQHPRASKQGVSYVIGDDFLGSGTNDEGPILADGDLTATGTTSSANIASNDARPPAVVPNASSMPIASIDDTFTTPDDSGSYHGREASPAVVNSNESLAHMDSMNVHPPAATSGTVSTLLVSDIDMDVEDVFSDQGNALAESVQQADCTITPVTETGLEGVKNSSLGPIQDSSPLCLDNIEFSVLPAWLIKPSKFLVDNFRGESEDALLKSFILLELELHPLNKKLGTKNRPDAVAHWMKHARMVHKVPSVIDLVTFPEAVRVWWASIQPEWRGSKWPLDRSIPDTEDWSSMKLGGPNGLFLFVMCLYWWWSLAKETSNEVACAEYLSVIEDVTFILRAIYRSTQNSNARSAVSTPTNLASKDGPISVVGQTPVRSSPGANVAIKTRRLRSRQ